MSSPSCKFLEFIKKSSSKYQVECSTINQEQAKVGHSGRKARTLLSRVPTTSWGQTTRVQPIRARQRNLAKRARIPVSSLPRKLASLNELASPRAHNSQVRTAQARGPTPQTCTWRALDPNVVTSLAMKFLRATSLHSASSNTSHLTKSSNHVLILNRSPRPKPCVTQGFPLMATWQGFKTSKLI